MAPRTKVHRMWTTSDREWLRELAGLHHSDKIIGEIMKRDPSAVAFQRRALRIRLAGERQGRVVGSPTPKPFVEEPHDRIERMLRYAAMVAPRFSIADVEMIKKGAEA